MKTDVLQVNGPVCMRRLLMESWITLTQLWKLLRRVVVVLVTTLDYSEYSGLFDLRTDLEDYDKPIDRFHLMLAASSACPPSWGSLGYVMATPRTMPLRMQADDGIEVILLLECMW